MDRVIIRCHDPVGADKKAKRKANDRELSPGEKRELTKQEKEYKSLRKQIQEKLIKFATRIPIFLHS